MIMASLDFLATNSSPSAAEVREAISSVICRCTGYNNIVKAVLAGAAQMRADDDAGPQAQSRESPRTAQGGGTAI
jgi:xanthine dehydrogenase iron-sulfur cluster and FAD-binding subunit A